MIRINVTSYHISHHCPHHQNIAMQENEIPSDIVHSTPNVKTMSQLVPIFPYCLFKIIILYYFTYSIFMNMVRCCR